MSSSTVFRGFVSRIAAEEKPAQPGAGEHPRPSAELSDECLMESIQSGNMQALGLLFDRYSRLVLSVGLRILRDAGEAQELVQDVFLYLFKKSRSFDGSKGSLRSWLSQIAYSRAFNRREYLVLRRFYDCCQVDEVIDCVSSDFSLQAQGEISELREILQEALAGLTERQRATLQLFFFEGYSLREISARLDETLGNTRNHYYRGLERLREVLTLSLAPLKRREE